MELVVNDKIRIQTDAYNYIVQGSRVIEKDGKTNKKGDIVWDEVSYHGNLKDACKSMVSKGIKFCDTFAEVMSFLALVYDKIDEIKTTKK